MFFNTKNTYSAGVKRTSRVRTWIERIFFILIISFLLMGGIFFIWVAGLEIPTSNIDERITAQSTKIFDKTGKILLYDVYKDERRTVVELDQISVNMKKAILATEDDEFYQHKGYDKSAIIRGVCYEISAIVGLHTFWDTCPRGGGSTITQQVIKNTLLNNDHKLERKIKEVVLANKLEKEKTKDEILEIYLNEIAFGGPIYGVEQASQSYFGKTALELTVAESAYLAALPKAPTTYLNNREKLDGRQRFILGRMHKLEYINDEQYQNALGEQIHFLVRADKGIKAPHFVFYALELLDQKLQEIEEDTSTASGYWLQTTLDWELQETLQGIATKHAERVGEKYNASNVSLVVIENKTGKIRSMIGSKDYFAEDIDGKFNITTALRQPGSTFKPFVYANAFNKGYLPDTTLWDTNTEFSTTCFPDGEPKQPGKQDQCYQPNNYDSDYRGPISLRNALAQSLNIPAVKLLYLVGVGDSMKLATDLGITTLTRSPNFYGLNLVLGGGEVRLLDMVSAYSVFANGGIRHQPAAWEQITDSSGDIIDIYKEDPIEVLSAQTASMVNDILSDDDAKRPIFGSFSSLYYNDTGIPVAVKTGTTNNFRDVWTIGYSSDVTVGVWAGNNDNTPMTRSPSSSVVGPFWREAMDSVLEYYDAQPFEEYTVDLEQYSSVLYNNIAEIDAVFVDSDTGNIITNPTDVEIKSGLYTAQPQSEYHSLLHYIDRSQPNGPPPNSPESDALYEHFEYGVEKWIQDNGWVNKSNAGVIDTLVQQISTQQQNTPVIPNTNEPEPVEFDFVITQPTSDIIETTESPLVIQIELLGDTNDVGSVYYYFNNSYLGSGSALVNSITVIPSSIRSLKAINVVKVVVELRNGERVEKTRNLRALLQ